MAKAKVKTVIDEKALSRIFTNGIERVIATDGYEIRYQLCGEQFTLHQGSMSCPRCGTSYRTR